ncbi:MAG: hypothetical protein QXG39_02565 [Candidatus Aenigmatarchaeota archaeon]
MLSEATEAMKINKTPNRIYDFSNYHLLKSLMYIMYMNTVITIAIMKLNVGGNIDVVINVSAKGKNITSILVIFKPSDIPSHSDIPRSISPAKNQLPAILSTKPTLNTLKISLKVKPCAEAMAICSKNGMTKSQNLIIFKHQHCSVS